MNIAQNTSAANYWFKTLAPATLTFSASSSGLTPGSLGVTVTSGVPTKLSLVGASMITTATCVGYTVSLQDNNGNTTNAVSNTPVDLAGGGSGSFFSDSGCSTSAVQVTIASGTSSKLFYFYDNQAESLTLTAARSAFVSAATGTLQVRGNGRIFRARVAAAPAT